MPPASRGLELPPAPGHAGIAGAPPLSSGPYVVEQVLGRGESSAVHAVRCMGGPDVGARFAMKRILPELTLSPSFVQMFCRGARLGQALRHPNLLRFVDFGALDGELVLVTEHVDGTSCARLIAAAARAGEGLPVAAALFVTCELLEALDCIHGLGGADGELIGAVHGDVSPENVLLGAVGEVKLADFGMASIGWHPCGALGGKLRYMSPEKVDGAALDGRSDLFSLGVVLFEMVTGRPFRHASDAFELVAEARDGSLAALSEPRLMAQVPLELRLILATALCPDRRDRFSDAREFGDALRAFARRSGTRLERRALVECLRRFDIWPLRSGTYAAVSVTELKNEAHLEAGRFR